MELTDILVSFVIVAIFLSAPTTDAGSTTVRCLNNSDCPSIMACFRGGCINKCELNPQKGRTCQIVNGEIEYKCDPGWELVQGDKQKVCYPVDWSCFIDEKHPDQVLLCDPPKWFCRSSFGLFTCVPS